MICTCTHKNCYFVFHVKGTEVPKRCPDCGTPLVKPEAEARWFCVALRSK